ncbi:uncharacterized protein LOC132925492 [Rhopalosiphum padi]|uniref:uncharacterized protein LOC132925492 n=1 Tax=Rhopalosiphum padi TaxID=40932 RepID=UPI00298EA4C6|nr:uncharacterized protein LOC132925492 [Rhopalosiphum padi]
MSTNDRNVQKVTKFETGTRKSTQAPLTANRDCFDDEDGDEDEDEDDHNPDYACINGNCKVTGLGAARSSCTDDILLKTLIAKYTKRLLAKLENIAGNVPEESEHTDAIVRLRKKFQRLLKDMDQPGGPSDSSNVLLNKYDCLRMAYYSVLDGIKAEKKTTVQDNNKNEKQENRENNEKLENRENNEKLEKRENSENNEKLDKFKKTENPEKFQNGEKLEKLENSEKRLVCEYCGKQMKSSGMTWGPNIRSDKDNFQKEPFELKSFLKNRFFIYFPCLCCMFGKSD